MASLSHLIRFSSIGLLKPAALSSLRYPSPVPFSRLNPAAFLFSRAVQYATAADDAVPRAKARASPSAGPSGKITDEFTGAGAFGQASQMDGSEAQNTGSAITYAAGPCGKITNEFTEAGVIGQVCQVDGSEALVREQSVLNTGSPITYAAAPPAKDPSAGPSGKITDEFTGAAANEQDEQDETEEFLWEKYADEIDEALRHAAAGTSSPDSDTPYPHPTPFTCLTIWDILYGYGDKVYKWYK